MFAASSRNVRSLLENMLNSRSAGVSHEVASRENFSASAISIWLFAANAAPRAKCQNAVVIARLGFGGGTFNTSSQRWKRTSTKIGYGAYISAMGISWSIGAT